MAYITDRSSYVPPFRLPTSRIREQWGGGTGGVKSKSVKAVDDDAVTLGIEAARATLPTGASVDSVVFATTTPVYQYGSTAPLICNALGLEAATHTVALTESSRAGTAALRAARELLSVSSGRALVVASEAPAPAPDTEWEKTAGAGAGAALLESEPEAPTGLAIEAAATCSRPILDEWQAPGSSDRKRADARFRRDVGYVETAAKAVLDVLDVAGWNPEEVDALVLNQPNPGYGTKLASEAGVPTDRVTGTDLVAELGDLAAASPLVSLARLSAERGDRIVVCGYGSGVADAIALTATADTAAAIGTERPTTELNYLEYLEHTDNLRRD